MATKLEIWSPETLFQHAREDLAAVHRRIIDVGEELEPLEERVAWSLRCLILWPMFWYFPWLQYQRVISRPGRPWSWWIEQQDWTKYLDGRFDLRMEELEKIKNRQSKIVKTLTRMLKAIDYYEGDPVEAEWFENFLTVAGRVKQTRARESAPIRKRLGAAASIRTGEIQRVLIDANTELERLEKQIEKHEKRRQPGTGWIRKGFNKLIQTLRDLGGADV